MIIDSIDWTVAQTSQMTDVAHDITSQFLLTYMYAGRLLVIQRAPCCPEPILWPDLIWPSSINRHVPAPSTRPCAGRSTWPPACHSRRWRNTRRRSRSTLPTGAYCGRTPPEGRGQLLTEVDSRLMVRHGHRRKVDLAVIRLFVAGTMLLKDYCVNQYWL